jgi:hypothetical protein
MKSLLQRLPSKEKEWKAVARAKEKFYGDAFAREAAVCRASLRAAASAPGDAKRCGADAGASAVVPLADHPKARVGVPACETAGSPNRRRSRSGTIQACGYQTFCCTAACRRHAVNAS